MGRVDNWRGAPTKIISNAPRVSEWIPKIIKIWDGRLKAALEINNLLYGDIKTYNLIKSTCFYLKISRVQVFCSKFSQVRMFCDGNRSKLVPEYTCPGSYPSLMIVNNLTKNQTWRFNTIKKGKNNIDINRYILVPIYIILTYLQKNFIHIKISTSFTDFHYFLPIHIKIHMIQQVLIWIYNYKNYFILSYFTYLGRIEIYVKETIVLTRPILFSRLIIKEYKKQI